MSFGIALHILAATLWVGGMFFVLFILRPSLGPFGSSERLPLMGRVLARFFAWVWGAIIVLLLSGYGMVFLGFGGFAHVGLHVHLMQATGILMMLLFAHLYFAPWKRFCRAVNKGDFGRAAKQLGEIRMIVTINLALGILTLLVGSTGRYWG